MTSENQSSIAVIDERRIRTTGPIRDIYQKLDWRKEESPVMVFRISSKPSPSDVIAMRRDLLEELQARKEAEE